MAFRKALWLPSTAYLPETDRLGLSAFLYPSGSTSSPLTVRSGVIPRIPGANGGPMQVSATGSPMVCNVQPGQAIVAGNSATQGAYIVTNDLAYSLTHAASNTQPRIDVIYIKVDDTNFSGATNDTNAYIVAGTPAASPAVPAAPTGALVLAEVTIRANTTSILTSDIADKRVWTGTLGTPLICTSATRPSNPYESQQVYETDTKRVMLWDGSTWRVAVPGVWTDYSASFVLASNGTQPTKGNSTYLAKYTQIGRLITYVGTVTIGSTFSAGSGVYYIPLPIASASAASIGNCYVFDSGTAARTGGNVIVDTTNLGRLTAFIANAQITSSAPQVWATADEIRWSITYEAA